VPHGHKRLRGILIHVSTDDSLHNTYGERKEKKKERINFKNIEIREYARTVGDNPSCSSGPPISISWEYLPSKVLPLEVYEETRPQRRSNIEMILPRDLRQRILRKEWDVTQTQIAAAVRNNIKVKNQRRTTVQNLGKSTKMEEAMENASKGLMAGLMGRSTDRKVKKLEAKMKSVELARKQVESDSEFGGCSDGEPEDTVYIDVEENGSTGDRWQEQSGSGRSPIVASED